MTPLRPALMPPQRDEGQVQRLSQLAHEIVASIDSGTDASPLIAAFCRESGASVGPIDFLAAAGSQSLEEYVRTLLTPSPTRDPDISRDDLVVVVSRVMHFEGSESATRYWIDLVHVNVPHPAVSDLFRDNLTAEQVVEAALAYKPLITPAPASDRAT